MGTLFDTVIQKIFTFLQSIWNQIFGGWNYINIFYWLPQDIRTAATIIIVTLFGFALWRFFMSVIPH